MTHAEGVARAAAWLRSQGCSPVYTERGSIHIMERPDAFGWSTGTLKAPKGSYMVEVKVSYADWRRDKDKPFRRYPELGLGFYRYLLVPKGLVTLEDPLLPATWGLLWATPQKVMVQRKATRFVHASMHSEILFMRSLLLQELAKNEALEVDNKLMQESLCRLATKYPAIYDEVRYSKSLSE